MDFLKACIIKDLITILFSQGSTGPLIQNSLACFWKCLVLDNSQMHRFTEVASPKEGFRNSNFGIFSDNLYSCGKHKSLTILNETHSTWKFYEGIKFSDQYSFVFAKWKIQEFLLLCVTWAENSGEHGKRYLFPEIS